MRVKKLFISMLFLLGVTLSKAGTTGSVANIVHLADSFKALLTSTQISTLQIAYSYSNAQTWSNLPASFIARKGISTGSLTSAQLGAAKVLIKEMSGQNVANEGWEEVVQLWLADDYLSANGGGTSYGAGNYYIGFFGTPTLTGTFEIMMTGHHKTVANTYNNGLMVGATPHFEAVEPLTFTTSGTTYSPITQEKNAFAAMLAALTTTELASAKLSQTFGDVSLGAANGGTSKDWQFPTTKVGIRVGNLTTAKKQLVMAAIKTYVLDVDSVNAAAILAQYQNQLDSTYIAYSGNATFATQADYVRIDGPGVWIEFVVQNGVILSGVHYHSIWRDHKRDFGGTGSTNGLYTTQIGSDTTVLTPIKMESTSVFKINENAVSVNWKTAYEVNSNYYEVEYGTDGKTFSTIATVESKNSLQGSSYSYTHNAPQKGKNYYRIKSVDNDGKAQYSSIMVINMESKITINTYPNPAINTLNITHNLEGEKLAYYVFDMNGRTVIKNVASNASLVNIDVSRLNKGNYVVTLQTESQTTQTKFIKQ